MNAAIYARKSTEQNGVADEAKSVHRQIEHARAYAARKGMVVDDAHVYVDDGVSGAEFANRPGFVRLMTAVKQRPEFGALIMSEESRLGREMIETGYALKQIITAGVRVFYYMEDRERTLDSATDKILMSIANYAGEVEREMARQRSTDAARQRAARGYVTGGTCFGYRNVRTAAGVTREIDPDEAAVVRQIFELCVAGKGAARICKVLNAEDAPAPRSQQRRPRGWVPSTVRAVLYRDAYRGEQVWGRSRKRNQWGQVAASRTEETKWIRTTVPALRIVDDDLWTAAHERLASSRTNYLRATDGRLWGKPANGVESKYLLTGMTRCGTCGGGLLVYPRMHGSPGRRRRVHVYACPRARVDLCTNDLEVPMAIADAAAMSMIADDALSPEVIELALDKLVAMLDEPAQGADARRVALTDAVKKLARELEHLQDAVAGGEPPETLIAAIRERERRHKDVELQLRALDRAPALRAAAPQLRREAKALLDDWRGLLGRQVSTTRQLLRKLLDGERFVFHPQREAEERWYELAVRPTLEKFFSAVPALKMSNPTHR